MGAVLKKPKHQDWQTQKYLHMAPEPTASRTLGIPALPSPVVVQSERSPHTDMELETS